MELSRGQSSPEVQQQMQQPEPTQQREAQVQQTREQVDQHSQHPKMAQELDKYTPQQQEAIKQSIAEDAANVGRGNTKIDLLGMKDQNTIVGRVNQAFYFETNIPQALDKAQSAQINSQSLSETDKSKPQSKFDEATTDTIKSGDSLTSISRHLSHDEFIQSAIEEFDNNRQKQIDEEKNKIIPIENRKFDSMDLAISSSIEEINKESIKNNRAYGGLVCKDSDGKYFLSKPIIGSIAGANPYNSPCLDKSTVVGDYHTHGNYSDKYGNATTQDNDFYQSLRFSRTDINGIETDGSGIKGYAGYLSTPDGTIQKYDPETKMVTIYDSTTNTFK